VIRCNENPPHLQRVGRQESDEEGSKERKKLVSLHHVGWVYRQETIIIIKAIYKKDGFSIDIKF
jgi:hypothetical protein